MGLFKRLLFEQPYLQAGIELVALAIALAGAWRARFEPPQARRWAVAAGAIVLLAIGGQLAQYFVVTDRERITAMLYDLAKAIERADVPALLEACDETLDANRTDKAHFGKALRKLFAEAEIREPKITDLQIEVSGPADATATVSGLATVCFRKLGYGRLYRGTWELGFLKRAGRWKIVTILPVEPEQAWP